MLLQDRWKLQLSIPLILCAHHHFTRSINKVPVRLWLVFSLILWNKGVTFSTIEVMDDDVSHARVQSPHVHHISAPTHVGIHYTQLGKLLEKLPTRTTAFTAFHSTVLSPTVACPKELGVLLYNMETITFTWSVDLWCPQIKSLFRAEKLAVRLQPMFSAFCRNG